MSDDSSVPPAGERLAKVIARAGLCSRRDAEGWIKDGRIAVNGRTVLTPAFNVATGDAISVDGAPLQARQGTRVWLYHKPPGLMVTEKDPEGRETIFDKLAEHGLPRVVTIGRLDMNTEGLLLLTNDGGLKRVLELPATGWLRRYRVRAFGSIEQSQLDALKDGMEVEGIRYGPIEATLERVQGSNVWLVVALREGKNREVKNVLAALGLQVNRLIRVSYGPFQLGDLPIGAVEVVKARILREQLGKRLAAEADVDFDSELPDADPEVRRRTNPKLRAAAPGKPAPRQRRSSAEADRFRFADAPDKPRNDDAEDRPRRDRPGRPDMARRPPRPTEPEAEAQPRRVLYHDGTEGEVKVKPARAPREGKDEARAPRRFDGPRPDRGKPRGDRPDREDRPRGRGDDRPAAPARSDRPRSDRPRSPRPPDRERTATGGRPASGGRPRSASSPRPDGDRPRRPATGAPGKRPAGPRGPGGPGGRPDRAARPGGPRPSAQRPSGSRPSSGPGGARPPRGPGGPKGPRSGPRPGGTKPPRKPRP